MKNKKLSLFVFIIFSLVFYNFLVRVVRAATITDTVEATVKAQNISVTVDNTNIDFGTIGVGSSANTTGAANETSIATNDGNIIEKLNIKAAIAGTDWTGGTTADDEVYTMGFCVAADCDASPSWSTVGFVSSYETLVASIGIGSTQPFDLQIGTPTITAHYTTQTITITVQAAIVD